ncbi:alpha-(1,6)-fucosyltransferase-like [Mercenaria mercenaria]|uniref:alpha-(1,6)-fucosyltransferase-like n=1 Tax=Mercenaria mercenaria TaxID=6596 RepID=UPI001E1D45AF|nr:alpha-(1,6)-fucosyltransferase-like [Mercenaria mercenaria]
MNRLNKYTFILIFLLLVAGIWQGQYAGRFTHDAMKGFLKSLEIILKKSDDDLHKTTNESVDEYKKIAELVQKRINELQNPVKCESARKVVCDLPPNGLGSQVHLLTICFTVGFLTERTVIPRYGMSQYTGPGLEALVLPFSNTCTTTMNQTVLEVFSLYKTEDIQVIKANYQTFYVDLQRTLPKYITDVIEHFHSNPSLWWAGQIATYILRPNKRLQHLIAKKKRELRFQNVSVGLHVRRTDKISEALYHNLTEYMKFAEKWYIAYEKRAGKTGIRRKIYLATDDPSVVTEARRDFPDYIFINDINSTIAANNRKTRYQFSSLIDILLDIYLLSECDYLVCTMSSNVCRLAFEMMQPRFIDASKYSHSLDCGYYIHRLYRLNCKIPLGKIRFKRFLL